MKTKATHDEIEKDVSTEVGDEVQRGIRSLKISKDGKLLASGDRLGNVRVYELETFSMLKYMEAHDAEVLTMDFSSDVDGLRFLSTGGRDRLIHIFDIKRSFELVQTIDDHSSSITAVRFSHSGRRLMSSAADKSIIFRKLTRYSDTPEFSVYHNAIGRATVLTLT
ncbi:WD40-repeat-containing domain protein [Chytridium lagenaria]|nr:WD40-repeat-containing domain protein [Chytridium lagenaria]